ncbi:hypothetical protein RUND412_001228 [Rhizina undulata]
MNRRTFLDSMTKLYVCWTLRKVPDFSQPVYSNTLGFLNTFRRFKVLCDELRKIIEEIQEKGGSVEGQGLAGIKRKGRRQSGRQDEYPEELDESYDFMWTTQGSKK